MSEEEILPKGLPAVKSLPLSGSSNEPASSFSLLTSMPQTIFDELSVRLATLNDSNGERVAPSSSQPTLEESVIPKEKLDRISSCFSPMGGGISYFETLIKSNSESPETSSSKERSSKSSLKKSRRSIKNVQISSPSSNNITGSPIKKYEEDLPGYLREISEKLKEISMASGSLKWKDKKTLRQLIDSFKGVVEIYREYYPSFQISDIPDVSKGEKRKHVQRRDTFAAISRNYQHNTSLILDMLLPSEVERSHLSSSPPPARPLRDFEKDSSFSPPSSPPLSPRSNRSFPSSPPPVRPGFSKNGPSASTPSLLAPQKEGTSSPRPLPVPPSGKTPSSSTSVSPPSSDAPVCPPRTRSTSTPVEKVEHPVSSSPTSPPPNRRWAQYSDAPVDLSGQHDQSD